MSHVDLQTLDTAFVRAETPTFAALIAALAEAPGLSPTRRRDLASGLRRVAKALGRSPETTLADPKWLQPRLARVAPAAAGLSPKSWTNALSDARAAMAEFGVVATRARRMDDLSPAWRALWTTLLAAKDPTLQPALCRFVHFLNTLGVAPEAVAQVHADAYLEAVALNEISKSPKTAQRTAVDGWNLAVRRLPDWPRQTLALPDRTDRIALPLTAFPAGFAADVERYIAGLEHPDPLDPEAPTRPMKPTTIRQRRFQIIRFASALVHDGVPAGTIDGLAALVVPETAERGLRWMLARTGNRTTIGISDTASVLRSVAKRHLRVPADQQARIDRLASRLAVPTRKGMTVKNRERLRVLEDPATLRRLLLLPEQLFARADAAGDTHAAACDREIGVAIAILLVCPVRRGNLAETDIERNLQRPGDGRVFLVFEAGMVKNAQRIEFELPRQVVELIDTHLRRRSPRLCPPGTPWLFPKRDGSRSMDKTQLSQSIARTIRRRVGIAMNAHLFRHLAAMIWLNARPGEYEAARRLLGHSELSSTLNAYAGFEAGTATRLFAELIDAARRG